MSFTTSLDCRTRDTALTYTGVSTQDRCVPKSITVQWRTRRSYQRGDNSTTFTEGELEWNCLILTLCEYRYRDILDAFWVRSALVQRKVLNQSMLLIMILLKEWI